MIDGGLFINTKFIEASSLNSLEISYFTMKNVNLISDNSIENPLITSNVLNFKHVLIDNVIFIKSSFIKMIPSSRNILQSYSYN
jgi:hypothetical protein